ncbi:ATP-dependent Clp protease adapter ClpS [candidate division KSB1 bacterium]|nr:ATP-dependent Clp protease adapter ClpS [candidate division KSB1 bacterium]RQW09079.1 MAG: ATP-dependent Clp protease adapter ClpS [candidate division KSB1 bacterium]
MGAQSDRQSDVVTQQDIDIEEPKLYKVLLHNDNYTTMEFVVQVLETIFYKSLPEATRIMLNVHQQGVGICGVYPYDVAETKVAQVHWLAKQNQFPLRSSLEEA